MYIEANERHDDGLNTALVVQSTLSLATLLITVIFTLAIVSNIKARNKSWNVYLVMLSLPDIIYNAFRFYYGIVVVNGFNTSVKTTWSVDWFYAVSNLYLNAVIVYQVHYYLRCVKKNVMFGNGTRSALSPSSMRTSQNRQRVQPPTIKRVLIQSLLVYLLGSVCGIWMHNLHTIGNTIAGSHPRFLQIHKISLCCMVIPPVTFVTLVCLDVWYHGLLPRISGRTRTIALYFLRVIFIFMVTWLPYMILITYGLRNSRLLGYIGMCLTSIQASLSVLVALSKDDIYWAVKTFITCQCNIPPPPRNASPNTNATPNGGNDEGCRRGNIHDSSSSGEKDSHKSYHTSTGQQALVRISGLFSSTTLNDKLGAGSTPQLASNSKSGNSSNRSIMSRESNRGSISGDRSVTFSSTADEVLGANNNTTATCSSLKSPPSSVANVNVVATNDVATNSSIDDTTANTSAGSFWSTHNNTVVAASKRGKEAGDEESQQVQETASEKQMGDLDDW